MNVGSDSLSRDCIDLSSTSYEFLLQNYAHTQVLKNLNIKPLPKDIVSFIESTLQHSASIKTSKGKRVSTCRCLNSFLVSIGHAHCLYLDGILKIKQHIIPSTFAQVVREVTFSTGNKTILVKSTVETTLSYVAQAFRSSNRQDPRLDNDGKNCFLIKEQYRGYTNSDSNKK